MTFTEAALEVLRSAGEPLHYKKITEIAIARNLLSHVGKTPEVTMSSRLATLVKKDRGQAPIVKVRPGVFAIRESSMQTDNDPTSSIPADQAEAQETQQDSLPAERPERPPLPGADVFPEEDDDDAPILAGLEEPAEDRGRRRRRRRRRGKNGIDGVEAGPVPEGARPHAGRPEDFRHEGRRDGRHERRDGRREPVLERPERAERPERPARFERADLDMNREPADGDLLGKDLADAAYAVLARGERVAHGFTRVAELLVRRGRLSGSPDALAPTVAAALRADAARVQRAHGRPRFRISGSQVSLCEWLLPSDAVRSAENVERGAQAQREQVRRAFMGRLNDLPAAGFAELVATWLNAEGVTALRAVRRPGSSAREFHFAGTLRRGAEENRLAIVVLRSGRDIDRETVVSVRGSLHHYGSATGAWLVTTGRIAGPAREESAAEGAPPCALFAGSDVAQAMELLGIGLRLDYVPLCAIDFDLLESLGDSGQATSRRTREPERDRDRDRGRERDRDRGRNRDRGPRTGPHSEQLGASQDADVDVDFESEAVQDAGSDDEFEAAEAERQRIEEIDLLDPDIAEASRLSPEARNWQDDASDTDAEDEERTGEHTSASRVSRGSEVDLDGDGSEEDAQAEDLSASAAGEGEQTPDPDVIDDER